MSIFRIGVPDSLSCFSLVWTMSLSSSISKRKPSTVSRKWAICLEQLWRSANLFRWLSTAVGACEASRRTLCGRGMSEEHSNTPGAQTFSIGYTLSHIRQTRSSMYPNDPRMTTSKRASGSALISFSTLDPGVHAARKSINRSSTFRGAPKQTRVGHRSGAGGTDKQYPDRVHVSSVPGTTDDGWDSDNRSPRTTTF